MIKLEQYRDPWLAENFDEFIGFYPQRKQRADWDSIKVDFMEKLLRAKLEQNPYVKKKLLETENYTICEDSPKDSFWGIEPDRKGQNQLGKLWMKLQDELRK